MRLERSSSDDLRWLERRAPCYLSSNARGITARDDHPEPMVVVGFDGWQPNSVWVHLAVRNPTAFFGQTIHEAWDWIFDHVGILMSQTRASNYRSIRFQKGLGFKEAYRIRDGYAVGEDLIVMHLRREDRRHGSGARPHGVS